MRPHTRCPTGLTTSALPPRRATPLGVWATLWAWRFYWGSGQPTRRPPQRTGTDSPFEPGTWLVLATLLSDGQLYSIAWPAPDIAICERALAKMAQPTL